MRGVFFANPKRMSQKLIHLRYVHLKDLQINGDDPKTKLPVHVIRGISDYTKMNK